VKTVVLGSPPVELEQLMQRRRVEGLDTFDEVWEGTYHVAPTGRSQHAYLDDEMAGLLRPYALAAGLIGSGPFNLGGKDDYRVPDRGYHRERLDVVYFDTAAVVIEIVSPDDETYEKLPFYAAHGVDEVLVIEPSQREVHIFERTVDEGYADTGRSTLLNVDATTLQTAINWP
jgi:Uma2 family endonuclease